MFTQVGVKQLTDFLRTVTAASDLVDCMLVNCESIEESRWVFLDKLHHEKICLPGFQTGPKKKTGLYTYRI